MDPRKSQRWIPEGEGIFLRGGCPRGQQSLGELAVLEASSPDDAAHGTAGGVGCFEYATSTVYRHFCVGVRIRRRQRDTSTARAHLKVCMRRDGGLQVAAEDDEPLDRTPAVPSSIVHHP